MEYNILKYMQHQRPLNHTPTLRFLTAKFYLAIVLIITLHTTDVLGTTLGSKCQHDMDCTDFIKGSSCSAQGYCECAPYYVQYNTTTCLSSQLLGGDCTLSEQCTMKVANSSCLDGACRCVEGFLQFRKHTCLGPAPPGSVCYSHAHCQMYSERTHCDFLIPNLFGRCQCTAPAKLRGGLCEETPVEVPQSSSTYNTTISTSTTTTTEAPIRENIVQPTVMADQIQQDIETENVSIEEEEWNDDNKDALVTTPKSPEEQTTLPVKQAITMDEVEEKGHENVDNVAVPNVTDDYPYKIDEEEVEHTEHEKEEHVQSYTEKMVTSEEEHIEEEHVEDYGNIVDNTMNFDYEAAQEEMEHEQEQEQEKQHHEEQQPISEYVFQQDHIDEQHYDPLLEHKQMDVEVNEEAEKHETDYVPKEEQYMQPEHVVMELEKQEETNEHEPNILEQEQTQQEQEHEENSGQEYETEKQQEESGIEYQEHEQGHNEEIVHEQEKVEHEPQQLGEDNQEPKPQQQESDQIHSQENEEEHQKPELVQLSEYAEEQQQHSQQELAEEQEKESLQNQEHQIEQAHQGEHNHGDLEEKEHQHASIEDHEYESEEKLVHESGEISKNQPDKEQEYEQDNHLNSGEDKVHEEDNPEILTLEQENSQKLGFEEPEQQQVQEDKVHEEDNQEILTLEQDQQAHIGKVEHEQLKQEESQYETAHKEQALENEDNQSQEFQSEYQTEQTTQFNVDEQSEDDKDKYIQQQQQHDEEEETHSVEAENIAEPDHITKLDHLNPDNDEIKNNVQLKPQQQQQESQTDNDEESLNESLNAPAITNEINDDHNEHSTQDEVVDKNESVQNENEATPQQQDKQQPEAVVMLGNDEVITTQTEPILEQHVEEEKEIEKEKITNNNKQIYEDNNSVGQIVDDSIIEQPHDEEDAVSLQEKTEDLPQLESQTENADVETAVTEYNQVYENLEIQSHDEQNKVLSQQQHIAADQIFQTANDTKQQQQHEVADYAKEEEEVDKENSALQPITEANAIMDYSDEEQTDSLKEQHVVANMEEQTEQIDYPYKVEANDHIEQATEITEHNEKPEEVNKVAELQEDDNKISHDVGAEKLENLPETNISEETLNEENITEPLISEAHTEESFQEQNPNMENSKISSASEHQEHSAFQDNTGVSESQYEKTDNMVEANKDFVEEALKVPEIAVQQFENDDSLKLEENKVEKDEQTNKHEGIKPEENQQYSENVNEKQQEPEHIKLEQQHVDAIESQELNNDNEIENEEMEANTDSLQLDIQEVTKSPDSIEDNEVLQGDALKLPQNNYFQEDIAIPAENEQFKESESISDILNDLMKGDVTVPPEFAEDSNYNIHNEHISEEEVSDLIAEDSNISEETVLSHEVPEQDSTESAIPPEDKLITFYPDMQKVHNGQHEQSEEEASGDDQKTNEVFKKKIKEESQYTLSPLDLPFDTSVDYEPQELEADNLIVETTTSSSYARPEDNNELTEITTTASTIQELTTQTMLNLASRVTLMEPAAPIVTTLKPLISTNANEDVTAEPAVNTPLIENLSTSKSTTTEIRKRVELSLEAVSLGLSCSNDKQCQLADPYTVCNADGKCDCAANTYTTQSLKNDECSAEKTSCSPGTFQCRSSGVCISWFFVCDGRPDCNDASDEECNINARLNHTCPSQAFQCGQSGRCISRAALCDGRKQCPHGEDEIGCSILKSEDSCPPHTFRCKSGECLPEYEYCNAIISCRDGSDEPPHLCGSRSMPNFFLQLLTAGGLMNKNMETNAYCPHRCSNGRCRSTAIVCSGRDGCGDGTDEQTCAVCRCPAISIERPPINVSEFLARHRPMPKW